MFLRQLFEAPSGHYDHNLDGIPDGTPDGEYDERQNKDDQSVADKTDTRKTRLTLKQVNRLRKLQDQKTAEYHEKMKSVRDQYGAAAGEEGGGGDEFTL